MKTQFFNILLSDRDIYCLSGMINEELRSLQEDGNTIIDVVFGSSTGTWWAQIKYTYIIPDLKRDDPEATDIKNLEISTRLNNILRDEGIDNLIQLTGISIVTFTKRSRGAGLTTLRELQKLLDKYQITYTA